MSDFRYRAFISYSHADEHWARWLQRAIESYRVPSGIASRTGVPRRDLVGSVFRDREDFSTAASLTDAIRKALDDSEFLIVICSPAAVSSPWVDAEVRYFRALGRTDRILCMVVAGDPSRHSGPDCCYPEALLEGARQPGDFPLAADPREFADGKTLTRLKLVAGLLQLPLDDLRRRESRRRLRRQVLAAMLVLGAAILALATVQSRLAEREQREKTEQLANFIVDLGEDLQYEIDSTSLARISEMSMRYLGELDWDNLSEPTGTRVVRALRRLGDVAFRQGNHERSLSAFERSLSLAQSLRDSYPDSEDIVYELGQAHFFVGNYHFDLQHWGAVRGPWQRYLDIAQEQHAKNPDDRVWLLELSYATSNMFFVPIIRGQVDEELLVEMEDSVDLAADAVRAWPDNPDTLTNYANVLAFAADAQLDACNLTRSLGRREEVLNLMVEALAAAPSSNDFRMRLAYAHSGAALVLTELGRMDEAAAHRRQAIATLESLAARDTANQHLQQEVAINRMLLAQALRETGRVSAAREQLERASPVLAPTADEGVLPAVQRGYFARLLFEESALLEAEGHTAAALDRLDRLDTLLSAVPENELKRDEARLLLRAEVFRWRKDPTRRPQLEGLSSLANPRAGVDLASCEEADLDARLALIQGDRARAREREGYLRQRGYRHPDYLRFCSSQGLCEERPQP